MDEKAPGIIVNNLNDLDDFLPDRHNGITNVASWRLSFFFFNFLIESIIEIYQNLVSLLEDFKKFLTLVWHLNIQGLIGHLDNLIVMLNIIDYLFDVKIMTETRLVADVLDFISMPGYSVSFNDRYLIKTIALWCWPHPDLHCQSFKLYAWTISGGYEYKYSRKFNPQSHGDFLFEFVVFV